MSVKKSSSETFLKPKPKQNKTNTVTRAAASRLPAKNVVSDQQKWLICPKDTYGWFRIINISTGKYLTSDTDFPKIQEKIVFDKKKDKKKLFSVKKVFIYCHLIPEFITFTAYHRNYADQDELQCDLGLDGGGGFFKILMSIQAIDKPKHEKSVEVLKKISILAF